MAGTIKIFCIYRKKILLHRIKSIYCSLHETCLPCKASIVLKLSLFCINIARNRLSFSGQLHEYVFLMVVATVESLKPKAIEEFEPYTFSSSVTFLMLKWSRKSVFHTTPTCILRAFSQPEAAIASWHGQEMKHVCHEYTGAILAPAKRIVQSLPRLLA